MVLAVSDNKPRFTIWATAMVDIACNISFSSCVYNEGAIEPEKISGLQAVSPVAHLSQVTDARPQQLPSVSEKR